jgi:hypothetical protein
MSTQMTLAVAAAVGFPAIAAFQAVLALGAPLGRCGLGRYPRAASGQAAHRERVRGRGLGARRTDHPGPCRVPGLPAPARLRPVGNMDPVRREPSRGADELRLTQQLGTPLLGPGRVDPGGAVPRRSAQRVAGSSGGPGIRIDQRRNSAGNPGDHRGGSMWCMPRLMQRNTSGEEVLSPDKWRSPSRWVTERGPQPLRSRRLAGAN